MGEQRSGYQGTIGVVREIGLELERVEREQAAAGRTRRRSSRGRRRGVVALATAGALLVAGAAGAASGLLPVGSVVDVGDRGAPHEGDHTIVAEGEAPLAGTWQLSAYSSGRLSDPDDGTVYQEVGLPCLQIELVDPPVGSFSRISAGCGHLSRAPGFSRQQKDVADPETGRREVLVYGRAPEHATAVEIGPRDGGSPLVAQTVEGPAGTASDYWLVAESPDRVEGHVRWVDERSGEAGPWVELLPVARGPLRAHERVRLGERSRTGPPPSDEP